MKKRISVLTIILIIFLIILVIRFSLLDKEIFNLGLTCDLSQNNLLDYESLSVSYSLALAGWVSCISTEREKELELLITAYISLIVLFLIMLSWKLDKLKKIN